MKRGWVILIAVLVLVAGGTVLAHEAGQRHVADPNSPSDLMMEQCTAAGLGPEGHTQVGRMIDQVHGQGAHHRMHQFMDQMMGAGGMGAGSEGVSGRMGQGTLRPRMMRGMMGRGI